MEGTSFDHSDAIEAAIVTFFFHMDDCNEYFIRGQWGDYVKRPLCGSGNAPELFSFYGLNNKEYDIE